MEERIILEKPDLSKIDAASLIHNYFADTSLYAAFLDRVTENDYLYWTKVKQLARPESLSPEEWWSLVRLLRRAGSRKIVIKTEKGDSFSWYRMQSTDEWLHKIDMYLGGQLMAFQSSIDGDARNRFIARGILEESISSSQLEGASTSRRVAKQMIAEKREPRNESEQMIYNNYLTLKALETEFVDKELSLDMLYEIHSRLTHKTIDPSETFRLRKDDDEIGVYYQDNIAHIPPKEDFLAQEILRFIDFANDKTDEQFTHPVVKAIFMHFWIGYLHPFTDGNGRLARALFYWYLLRKDYWVLMYLPISSAIKRAPGQYAHAYIFSEQDDLDITYFYDFHMHKILQAIDGLKDYIARIDLENKQLDRLLGKELVLNDRQKRLLHHVLADNGSEYSTITAHMTLNTISRPTAYEDVRPLLAKNILEPRRVGHTIRYYASEALLSLAGVRRV